MTFGDGANKYLRLLNEEYGREISLGSSWTRIRVGAMLQLEADGINNIGTGSLRFGMSSAKGMHAGSGTAGLWLGGLWASSSNTLSGGTWTYTAAGGNPHFRAGGLYRAQILAGVISGAFSAGGPSLPTGTGSTLRCWPLMMELKKSGTTMIVAMAAINNPSDVTSANYFTRAHFLDAMVNPADGIGGSWPTINGVAIGSFGSSTFASYPTNAGVHGEVDAVQIGWNKTTKGLRIFDLAVTRFE